LNALPKKTAKESSEMPKHLKAFEVKRLIGNQIWEDYFSFTFIRNPWDLMVSSYSWWLQKAPKHKRIMDCDIRNIRRMGSFTELILSKYGRTMINEYEGNLFDWISENGKIIVDFVGVFLILKIRTKQIKSG
jgi:hypothetical protein